MRMDFKTFLIEGKSVQQSTNQRTHSEHVNHLVFDGHDSMAQIHDTMSRIHNFLLGRRNNIPKLVSTKIDGAPAIHFLKDENGRIGIATKGVFNKDPKIAWTHEDVTKHYGHAPGLEEIMHTMLDHGHKILPADMKPGEMYKGDVLKKAGTSDGHSVLHSNLLKYKFPKGSSEADQIDNSKVGVALHTYYDKKGRASAISPQQRAKFRSHPDVFNMNPDIQVNAENYTPDEQREFNTHMENARTEYQRLKPEAYDAVGHHNMDMRAYANDVVRRGTKEPLTTEGYVDFLTNKHKKDIAKYKTQGSIDKKSQAHSEKVNEIMRNKEHFDKLFKIHDHVQKAKDVLIGVMDKNNPSHVELPNGQPTRHEGYMTDGGIKLVDQDNFSKNNFAFGAMQQAKKGEINEAINLPENSHVSFVGRTQPPHRGHLQAIQGAMDHADKTGASHTILLTHTHNKDNPLTPEQKLYYAQRSFPGANIQMTSPEAPSLLHHASQLHAQGIRNFTVFAGPERLASYEKLLNSYNGVKGPHGYYKFDNIKLMSSGDRDPDAEGVEGASGTAMKKAAMEGDKETFHSMGSPHLSPADKNRMMKDVQAGLAKFAKPVKNKTKQKAEPFNPGTPVYVEHGSNAAKSIKESTRLSFRQLLEKTKGPSYQDFIDDPDYQRTKRSVLSSLNNDNDHISKGGPDAVHGALDKHYDLSSNPHSEHFDYYSDVDASYPINSSLFHHHNEGGDPNELPDEDINDISHDDIKGLDKALSHKKTPKPMTVFSGVGFNPGMMAAKHPENQLYMPSYTSTSIDPKVAADFAKPLPKGDSGEKLTRYNPSDSEGADHHVLRINLPKGQQGSYIAGSSNFPEEKEFLLPRQQTMKIDPTPEVHEFEHNGRIHKLHVWNATPTPTKLPKPVTEQVTTADARGFGYVTGDPAVDGSVTTNDVDASFFRGNLRNSIKQSENPLAKMIGFKAFDPNKMNSRDKSLTYYHNDPNAEPLLRDKIRNRGKNNNATKG